MDEDVKYILNIIKDQLDDIQKMIPKQAKIEEKVDNLQDSHKDLRGNLHDLKECITKLEDKVNSNFEKNLKYTKEKFESVLIETKKVYKNHKETCKNSNKKDFNYKKLFTIASVGTVGFGGVVAGIVKLAYSLKIIK